MNGVLEYCYARQSIHDIDRSATTNEFVETGNPIFKAPISGLQLTPNFPIDKMKCGEHPPRSPNRLRIRKYQTMDGRSNTTPEIQLKGPIAADVEARIRRMIGNRSPDTETQLALAEALFDKGDDAEAVRILQVLIFVDPTCLRAYDRLVDTLTRLRRLKDAAEVYREWGRQLASQAANTSVVLSSDAKSSPQEVSIADSVAHYYAVRAPEYDQTSSYQTPGSGLIDGIKAEVQATVLGRDAIEIACGTGFWTSIAAGAARSLVATDRNIELVEMVRQKMSDTPHVTCQVADAYTLDGVSGPFSAAYAQFWWSHIPRSMIRAFLVALHSKLVENAQVFFMDSLPYLMRDARRLDEEGNVVEPRVLLNGQKYEVIKNFPTESELREALADFADDVRYRAYEMGSVWTVSYKARRAA